MTQFKSKLGPFRSKLAEDIFVNKYSHDGCETWYDLSKVLINDVCGGLMPQDEIGELIQMVSDMKFIPGGRYLYYAGRQNKYFNNCLKSGTNVLTIDGWRDVSNLGKTKVFSPRTGEFLDATFNAHGVQQLQKITFAPLRGKSHKTWTVETTRNHRWILKDGKDTVDIRVGDVIPANDKTPHVNGLGFLHGFIFGDGNKNGQVRLCGDKKNLLPFIISHCDVSVTYPINSGGDPVVYSSANVDWKSFPDIVDPVYVSSFIRGWLSADGSETVLSSVSKENLEWFVKNCPMAGIVSTGEIRSQTRNIKLGKYSYENHEIFMVNYTDGSDWQGFKVISIEPTTKELVFCPYEPIYQEIVIDNGLVTGNCYLLKAEEDTREDWASLSYRAENCLMSGGGIGVDYSVYRDSGQTIKKTGGRASGPIPKMLMINEIGRNVMQGGSRRSAIYASLNWKHGDIDKFLKVKDWHNMPIPGTDKSFWDAKVVDFNFNAPLDMTNISVNYDTEWLLNYYKTGDVGEVFKQNVKQALTTGEPGFSFNFFDKEKETLRNACTEVSSEDDSDVCNLGSVNMSRIDNLEDFRRVVELSVKFLLCGTIKADLPYEKVYKVREKNRRLGLGLMGIHEWLLKKGHRYEMNDELRRWMEIYKKQSDKTSKDFSEALGVSRPVANRSIAPTGSIGLLAGTTTGIEPVYAVAYKRRYLTNGTKWKYQYAVDSTAEVLLNLGVKEEDIETAIDLANDYERRMKFQADVQDYVDMAISSTINLPPLETTKIDEEVFAKTLAKYASRLRGFTVYPDGSRGGQPITSVPYKEVVDKLGEVFDEHIEVNDVCEIGGKGGVCGS